MYRLYLVSLICKLCSDSNNFQRFEQHFTINHDIVCFIGVIEFNCPPTLNYDRVTDGAMLYYHTASYKIFNMRNCLPFLKGRTVNTYLSKPVKVLQIYYSWLGSQVKVKIILL